MLIFLATIHKLIDLLIVSGVNFSSFFAFSNKYSTDSFQYLNFKCFNNTLLVQRPRRLVFFDRIEIC